MQLIGDKKTAGLVEFSPGKSTIEFARTQLWIWETIHFIKMLDILEVIKMDDNPFCKYLLEEKQMEFAIWNILPEGGRTVQQLFLVPSPLKVK